MRNAFCLALIMAACPSPEAMAAIVRQWQEMTSVSGLDKDMSLADTAWAR